MGCAYSAVGALIGAGIWYAVASATGYEIGWIAWGVGILAGMGMMIGTGGPSEYAGMLAAAIGGGGVMAAKLMMFYFIFVPVITGQTTDPDQQREFVAMVLTDEAIEADGGQDMTEEQWDQAWDRIYPETQKQAYRMSDKELADAFQRYRDEMPTVEASWDLFFETMFEWMDIIFCLLAVGTAYKVAGSTAD